MQRKFAQEKCDCIVFAYRFLPFWSVGAKRNLAYANALSQIYRHVYVITGYQSKWPQISGVSIPSNVSIKVLPTLENFLFSPPSSGVRLTNNTLPLRPRSTLKSKFLVKIARPPLEAAKSLGFLLWALGAFAQSLFYRLKSDASIGATFALTMPWECILPSWLNLAFFQTPYHLDIRDAWSGNPSRRKNPSKLLSFLEHLSIKYANSVFLVTDGLLELYSRLRCQPASRLFVVPNSISELDIEVTQLISESHLPVNTIAFVNSESCVNLVYTGRINDQAVPAVGYFHKCLTNAERPVSLIAAGTSLSTSVLGKANLYSRSIFLDQVDYFQSRALQVFSDGLLVFLGIDYGVNPVKLNEYLLSSSPILLVCMKPLGSELSLIIENHSNRITILDMSSNVEDGVLSLNMFLRQASLNKLEGGRKLQGPASLGGIDTLDRSICSELQIHLPV